VQGLVAAPEEELGAQDAIEEEDITYEVVRLPRRKWMEDPAE
jgi:hypothetical protein